MEDIDQKRIRSIFRMLVAMSRGNFSYKIKRTGCHDSLEALIMGVNMTVEEMRETFSHYSYINPHDSYRHLVQMSFVLDHRYHIRKFNAPVPDILRYEAKAFGNTPFKDLLSEESQKVWEVVKDKLSRLQQYAVQLVFATRQQFLVPAFCTISRLNDTDGKQSGILITSTETVLQEDLLDNTLEDTTGKYSRPVPFQGDPDIQLLQKVYDHILNNLEKPLPSAKELARDFGTNEYKLKKEFKQVFHKTIFQFQYSERFKKARLLVEHSGISLTKVAKMTGFKDYPNFSRAFKKKFGYSPKQWKKHFFNKGPGNA
ncbi:helix-turn-helix domain-containing protein [Sinomicrobium kalidii]|uniref:helix-turn-helix domain-containing protein n=1 Tax=Sinomicrobium kalidii TaxID=2900738 RepID=UPI001E3390D3|nr:helix-turn-helix domain-containing protein [Sinomicrobium kalidii]UGU15403.1 helix-turn-helix domain-containing protein [Sinomicrobium kalidii]